MGDSESKILVQTKNSIAQALRIAGPLHFEFTTLIRFFVFVSTEKTGQDFSERHNALKRFPLGRVCTSLCAVCQSESSVRETNEKSKQAVEFHSTAETSSHSKGLHFPCARVPGVIYQGQTVQRRDLRRLG